MSELQRPLGPRLSMTADQAVEADGNHDCWLDSAGRPTPYYGTDIWVKVRRITRSRLTKLQEFCTRRKKGRSELDGDMLAKLIFQECLIAWNLRGDDDKILPITEAVKEHVVEHYLVLAQCIGALALTDQVDTDQIDPRSPLEKAEADEDLSKNS